MAANDEDRSDFLRALDNSRHEVNDWEAKFIGSNLDRTEFTPKQREVIDKLMEKYSDV